MFVAEGATRRLREAERRRFLDTVWPPVAEQIKRLGISAEDLDLRRV
jgi:GntR family transcriptional regulator